MITLAHGQDIETKQVVLIEVTRDGFLTVVIDTGMGEYVYALPPEAVSDEVRGMVER